MLVHECSGLLEPSPEEARVFYLYFRVSSVPVSFLPSVSSEWDSTEYSSTEHDTPDPVKG